jgi:hypothetical protein
MTPDAISPEIRNIEHYFDNAYRSNPLVNISRPTATWMLLGAFEAAVAKPYLQDNPTNLQKQSLRENGLINALKHALSWLRDCPAGSLQAQFADQTYRAAYDLLFLGGRYDAVETVFVLASRGHHKLTLEGRRVVPLPLAEADAARFYAYNRFIATGPDLPQPTLELSNNYAQIADRVKVTGEGFRLKLDPRFVDQAMSSYEPVLNQRFHLPESWRTTRYSFGDLKLIYLVLSTLAAIHFEGRLIAAGRGAIGSGFNNAVLRFGCNELRSRVSRYSGLEDATIEAIVEDLSYGSRGVERPDPALQPLIPINSDVILLAPSLVLCSSSERNHCALLNSIPEEQEIYSRLVSQKEALMRGEILGICESKPYRHYNGRISGHADLGDIDLALIDENLRLVLLLEMKWFIAPDEIWQVLKRGEELKKGVSQAKRLRTAFREGTNAMLRALNIPPDFECRCAVVSYNWVGGRMVQDDEVPIITLRHLLEALEEAENLARLAEWLADGRYLPTEGVHFRVVSKEISIGQYGTVWWDIEPLISGKYDAVANL